MLNLNIYFVNFFFKQLITNKRCLLSGGQHCQMKYDGWTNEYNVVGTIAAKKINYTTIIIISILCYCTVANKTEKKHETKLFVVKF